MNMFEEKTLSSIAVSLKSLTSIAESLEILAEHSYTPESVTRDARASAVWIHTGDRKVACSRCMSKVSLVASTSMNYCFNCGAKISDAECTVSEE